MGRRYVMDSSKRGRSRGAQESGGIRQSAYLKPEVGMRWPLENEQVEKDGLSIDLEHSMLRG